MELGAAPGPQAAREESYDQLAGEYFRPEAFARFRRQELAFLPGLAEAYRASPELEAHVAAAVAALFPEHEHAAFTEWFLERMRPGSPSPTPWYGSRPSAPA